MKMKNNWIFVREDSNMLDYVGMILLLLHFHETLQCTDAQV